MSISLLERLRDWNPQLFREIKGRLKVSNIALAIGSSLLGQFLILLGWWKDISSFPSNYYIVDKFCRLRDTYQSYQEQYSQLQSQYSQLQQQFRSYSGPKQFNSEKVQALKGKIADVKGRIEDLQQILKNIYCPQDALDLQPWWQNRYAELFAFLSVILVLVLFVGGSYLLISDLSKEERKGTLNFIRLTPRSETSILTGKMLGVPILLYILAVAAVPLHLWAGLGAKIPFSLIFTFYGVLVIGCIFFYSGALLFGLISTWLGRFQAWLGSGALFAFLVLTYFQVLRYEPVNHPMVWLRLFTPFDLINYLFLSFGSDFVTEPKITSLQWFYLEVGGSTISLVALMLLNYGLCTYWIWQGLKRRFRNQNSTIISKQQSYGIVACFELMIWGFTLQKASELSYSEEFLYHKFHALNNLPWVFWYNVLLLFGLIAVLSPGRQALQDWARYRRENVSGHNQFWKSYLVRDLIFGEKSPAIVAMAINLLIATTPLVVFILVAPIVNYYGKSLSETKMFLLCSVAFLASIMMIYAIIAQLILLTKHPKRSLLATVTIGGLFFVPPIMLILLKFYPYKYSTVWLFSNFPWIGIGDYFLQFDLFYPDIPEYPTMTAIFIAFLCELGVLTLLNVQLTQRLQKFGESASKSLLKDSPTLPRSSFK